MTRAMTTGIYDPITNGHLNIIERTAEIFDEVIVGVAKNDAKHPMFSLEERIKLVRQSVKHLPNVIVKGFDNLLVEFAEKEEVDVVVRGLRATTDFEYEFQMNAANCALSDDFEYFFLMAAPKDMFLSSSIVRQIASYGGDISRFVPKHVEEALRAKCN